MTAMDDPGRKLSEALRARAGQTSGNPFEAAPAPAPLHRPPSPLAPSPGPQGSGRHAPVQQSMQQPFAVSSQPPSPAYLEHESSGMWSQQAVNATGARRGRRSAPRSPMNQVAWALTVALLGGAVLGCALALLSVLVPGLLPPLG